MGLIKTSPMRDNVTICRISPQYSAESFTDSIFLPIRIIDAAAVRLHIIHEGAIRCGKCMCGTPAILTINIITTQKATSENCCLQGTD